MYTAIYSVQNRKGAYVNKMVHDIPTSRPAERRNSSWTGPLPSVRGRECVSSLSCQPASVAARHSATGTSPTRQQHTAMTVSRLVQVGGKVTAFTLPSTAHCIQCPDRLGSHQQRFQIARILGMLIFENVISRCENFNSRDLNSTDLNARAAEMTLQRLLHNNARGTTSRVSAHVHAYVHHMQQM